MNYEFVFDEGRTQDERRRVHWPDSGMVWFKTPQKALDAAENLIRQAKEAMCNPDYGYIGLPLHGKCETNQEDDGPGA